MAAAGSGRASTPFATPIQHVVIVYKENHSFDNVLGQLCLQDKRCDGANTGLVPNGSAIELKRAPDYIPNVAHTTVAQTTSIDGGKMDGFAKIAGCSQSSGYACY